MTPNVSRLLIKWGVADVIGENLVEVEELNMRRRDGTVCNLLLRFINFIEWSWRGFFFAVAER
jgi:hypothetical protein